ncbi:MAG TPA: mannose-1-phosphate guanylyltransferase [Planctomycetota bacterium]|nr:mannose-1-phosphate guanylyltransferase [Planctomycetota bacterium]
MSSLHAVIMAGGSGTRFWPASRAARPKQFLPLAGGRPLLQAAVERLHGMVPPERLWIVTNALQAKALPRLLPDFPRAQIIVEPEPRDTAPCVALATATIAARDPAAIICVLPADHVIEPVAEFQRMLHRGIELAGDGRTLVTFGIAPTFAATGYGYIECGEPLDQLQPVAHRVLRFCEKPDQATAEQFVRAGSFLWNSGIFVWSVPAIRAAMARGDPQLAAGADKMLAALQRGNKGSLTRAFKQTPKTSIDYAVMERAEQVAVVRATVRWDDVGSFTALEAIAPKDQQQNATLLAGGAACVALHSQRNVVYAEGARTVALLGVDDLVVVAVGDAVLVCTKARAKDLKALVEQLQAAGRQDLL